MNDHLRATQIQRRVRKPANPEHSGHSKDHAKGSQQKSTAVSGCTGRIENVGPGKNVLVGYSESAAAADTEEPLTLEEFGTGESGEAVAFDPYNTGRFDRSASWSKILRK